MSARFVVKLETGFSFSVGGYKVTRGRPLVFAAGDPALPYFLNSRRFSVTELPGPTVVPVPELDDELEPELDDELDDELEPETGDETELDDEPDDVPEWTPYELREMKRTELAELAEKLGFDVRASDRKADLIAAIESTRG